MEPENKEREIHTGGCECKSVQYQLTGKPLTCYACHCTDCQTSSGSAFSLSMIVYAKDIKLTKDKTVFNLLDYSGTPVRRHHCEKCGTALWMSADDYPDVVALKPGTLDDTKWFKPIAHVWVRSAQPWITFDKGSKKYPTQPEMSELIELWAKKQI